MRALAGGLTAATIGRALGTALPDAGGTGRPATRRAPPDRFDRRVAGRLHGAHVVAMHAPPSPGLARRLRDETRTLHLAAERSAAMSALLRGRMDRPTYARLLRTLHVIYDALERGLGARADHPTVAAIHHVELARAARLACDLKVIAGAAWETTLDPLPGARAYAERLEHLAAVDPVRLVAHAYVRYLGDLSGGRHLARAVQRALAVSPERGAAFYEFPDVADVEAFKDAYRATLDALPVDAAGADRIVDEARWAFAAHAALFAALDAGGSGHAGALDDDTEGGVPSGGAGRAAAGDA
ncbi:MAG: biliverdin-producing heme oxygenase [Gemmatirosa sp.]